MSALVSYSSSDEEDNKIDQQPDENSSLPCMDKIISTSEKLTANEIPDRSRAPVSKNSRLISPIIGPKFPDTVSEYDLPEDPDFEALSPYSKNRAMLRNLTIPKQPNYNVPPSPAGSAKESTEKKFSHFLNLKKQGIHFNQKLANSTALKNPSVMRKLMDFAGISEIGQYMSTLPNLHWDPSAFPDCSYKDELSNSQQKILKEKEDDKARGCRASLDFVSSTT